MARTYTQDELDTMGHDAEGSVRPFHIEGCEGTFDAVMYGVPMGYGVSPIVTRGTLIEIVAYNAEMGCDVTYHGGDAGTAYAVTIVNPHDPDAVTLFADTTDHFDLVHTGWSMTYAVDSTPTNAHRILSDAGYHVTIADLAGGMYGAVTDGWMAEDETTPFIVVTDATEWDGTHRFLVGGYTDVSNAGAHLFAEDADDLPRVFAEIAGMLDLYLPRVPNR